MRRLYQKRIHRYWQNCQCKAAFQELGEGRGGEGRGGSGGGQSEGEREGDEIESNWERKEKMQPENGESMQQIYTTTCTTSLVTSNQFPFSTHTHTVTCKQHID